MSNSRSRGKGSLSRDSKMNRTSNDHNDASNQLLFDKLNSMELQPLKKFEIPALTTLIQRFRKEIEGTIELQTSIFNSKCLQRCLEHNNVTTLYCISDKKPLCVTCMYQNNIHKKHKVVPLNRANRDLEDEKNRNMSLIENEITLIDRLINNSHNNLTRSENEFPEVISSISDFYKELHELLSEKKNEQIRHVQSVWQKMRYQYSALAAQFSKIKIYMIEQIRQIKKRDGDEFLLFNRNICCSLAKVDEIIRADMCPYHETSYKDELRKFRAFEIEIGTKLALTSPFKEKEKREVKQSNGFKMSEKSKRILQNVDNMNAPVDIPDFFINKDKDNGNSVDRKARERAKSVLAITSKTKRASFSPIPFKPKPAVSAHKPPIKA